MNRKFTYLVLLLIMLPSVAFSQKYRPDEDDDPRAKPQKVGVRTGASIGWLTAENLQNPQAQIGMQGAIYYRINLSGNFHLQTEFGAAYRGSKFNNGETGYSRLGLFYLDVPIYAMFSLNKKQDHNILVGPMVSHLVRPALFLGKDYYPSFTNLPLKKFDYYACLTYIFSTELVGLSVSYKHGLTDIMYRSFRDWPAMTDGQTGSAAQYLNDVTPDIKNVRKMFVRSIELSLYF